MAASPGAVTLDSLNGLFKEIYADQLENLIPDGVKLLNKIPFAKKEAALGGFYHQPVTLGLEHGVTFAASGDDAFELSAPVAGQTKDATVRGTQAMLRSAIGLASVSRSMSSKAAFKQATAFLVGNMLRSITKKLEIQMLYGQVGYGVVGSVAGNVITIPTAEFAAGIWAGGEKMPLEIRNAAGNTSRGTCSVTVVDIALGKITVDTLPAGVVATDIIWHKTAYGNEFAGIHKILSNTGVLFGIDASQYSMFKGNVYDAGAAALSFAKIQDAVTLAVNKGLDEDVVVLVNPAAWSDLNTDQAALRMLDSSYSSASSENGSKELVFHSQNGKLEIMPSIYVKQGYAYVLCMGDMLRIGSTDVTFKRPGKGDDFFRELENHAGYEMRAYSDQSLFNFAPAKNVLISGIV